jgi:four helix bundle protein
MTRRMAVKRYQDLVVWQAADQVRLEVYRLTRDGPASRDFRFRDQLRSSASSIAANITEGFRRFGPRDFARFLDIAFASAGETEHWLDDGIARGHWTEHDLRVVRMQLRRLDAGLRSLMRYLRSPEAAARSQRRPR